MGNMKIKAKINGDMLNVKLMVKHEMLTYNQAKSKGKEANFITRLTAKVGDQILYDASLSQFISKDPLLKFKVKAEGIKAGDELEITWIDLLGQSVTERKQIKG